MRRILTPNEVVEKLSKSLSGNSQVLQQFSAFADDLHRHGVKFLERRASVAVHYVRQRSKTLSILIITFDGTLWPGFWLRGQLSDAGISSALAQRFWDRLKSIDERFEACDKLPRTHHVPIKEIGNRLPAIAAAVDELIRGVEAAEV